MLLFGALVVFAHPHSSHRHSHSHSHSRLHTAINNSKIPRALASKDPTDFTWVKRFAAIGDSFTAGIGSGAQLGSYFHNKDDWDCSRYDQSYPMIIKNYVGSEIRDFQYPACSGDQSWGIYDQARALQGNIDLLTLTAGGNDLCLADIIKSCIVLPVYGPETCNTVIQKAKGNLDLIMRKNLKDILLALKDKMATDGVVVMNSYARYFNTENEDCARKQDWTLYNWILREFGVDVPPGVELTIARRKMYNELAMGLNDLTRDVVEEVQKEVDFHVGFSDWDLWAIEGVEGQMCHPSSSGAYPDPNQPDLIFFKPDSRPSRWRYSPFNFFQLQDNIVQNATVAPTMGMPQDGVPPPPSPKTDISEKQTAVLRSRLRRFFQRDLDENGIDRAIYKSILWNSPNPRAAALKKLDPRAPSMPGCPGDKDVEDDEGTIDLGKILPDFFGRIFHPNELGHTAIASFAIESTIALRARALGVEPQICELTNEFKCWQKEGRKGYATADRMDANYKDFCDKVEPPGEGAVGWEFSKTYHKDTPDEHEFVFELGELGREFSREACLESFKRIIHGCDGGDPENPLNWKFGGMWKRDQATYTVNVKRTNRPWPLKKPYGYCEGRSYGTYSKYAILGRSPFSLSSPW